MTSVKDKL